MLFSRKHKDVLEQMTRDQRVTIPVNSIDKFIGSQLYLSRVAHQNGYKDVKGMVEALRGKRPTVHGKWLEYL